VINRDKRAKEDLLKFVSASRHLTPQED